MRTFLRFSAVMLVVAAVLYFAAVKPVVGIYNTIQEKDQAVKAGWSQVVNVYKRRADLVPNIVRTVRAYAAHEQGTLVRVTEARAKANNTNINIDDPNALQAFSAAQGELQSALSRLMVIMERYPDLKANRQFEALQAQLEGSENRIAVERQRFIESVRDYNTYIRVFPNNFIARHLGYAEKANFTVQNEAEISDAPVVDFDLPTSSEAQ
ncbi:MAG: LemA family protein [Azoarcus sp.]|jgi:LemA protein|nr:LemA family protein [Azoarcus sp.]MDR1662386.1 LemA family protein [Azoarcus sp.]